MPMTRFNTMSTCNMHTLEIYIYILNSVMLSQTDASFTFILLSTQPQMLAVHFYTKVQIKETRYALIGLLFLLQLG